MSSKTAVCNLALLFLGATPITAAGPGDKNSRTCEIAYDPARRVLLESYAWTFARNRAVLSRLSTTPAFGWDYQFALPTGCIMPYKVNDELNLTQQPLWDVEGGFLLTNEETVNLNYTKDIEDATLFTPGFIRALAALIAADISDVIKQDKGATQTRMLNIFSLEFGKATTNDANKGFMDVPYQKNPWNSPWIKARG